MDAHATSNSAALQAFILWRNTRGPSTCSSWFGIEKSEYLIQKELRVTLSLGLTGLSNRMFLSKQTLASTYCCRYGFSKWALFSIHASSKNTWHQFHLQEEPEGSAGYTSCHVLTLWHSHFPGKWCFLTRLGPRGRLSRQWSPFELAAIICGVEICQLAFWTVHRHV